MVRRQRNSDDNESGFRIPKSGPLDRRKRQKADRAAQGEVLAEGDDQPLSKKNFFMMMGVMLALGYIIVSETTINPIILVGGGVIGFMFLFFTGMRNPQWPLYALTVYLPFSKILAGDFGGLMTALNMTNILIVIILWSWFTNSAAGRAKFEPNILHLPVFLYAAWAVISFSKALGTADYWYFSYAFNMMKRWLDPILIYFLIFHLVREKQRWKNISVIIMIGVTIAALMAINEYRGNAGSSFDKARVGGIARQPNILGAFFVYYMFTFAAFWIENIKKPRYWAMLIPFMLCFRGIMVTFSRGAYLAFAQAALGLAFFKSKKLFFATIGVCGLLFMFPQVLPEGIQYRMSSTFKDKDTTITGVYGSAHLEEELDTSAGHRLIVWGGAWRMIQDYPMNGVGLGLFPFHIRNYAELDKWIDAHNMYLVTAAELGIPALIFFLIAVVILFRMSHVVYKNHPDPFIKAVALGYLAGLSGMLMANMFGSRLNSNEVAGYFWVMAALIARAHVWTKEIMEKEKKEAKQTRIAARRGA